MKLGVLPGFDLGDENEGRRESDFYETGARAIDHLLAHVQIVGTGARVFEPCAGLDAITRPLRRAGLEVLTNDYAYAAHCVDVEHDTRRDARYPDVWRDAGRIDWTITNPPFSDAYPILLYAWRYSLVGVAFLLRLSFLEPTRERRVFLRMNPPDVLLVLPRYSFTGDGKSDSVTCAWMVWYPRRASTGGARTQRMVVCTDEDVVGGAPEFFDRGTPDA